MNTMTEHLTDVLGINYSSKDWFHIKQILLKSQEDAVSKLVGDCSAEETNKIRGLILAYKTILALESFARDTLAQQEVRNNR